MSSDTYDVVCAGVIYLDLTFAGLEGMPRPGEELWARELAVSPGGMANTAAGLVRLGLRTAVVGAIGRDLAGSFLRSMLVSAGIACRGLETEHSAVTAVLPIDGDRALVSYLPEEVAAAAQILADLQPRALVTLVDQVVRAPAGTRVYAVSSHADITAAARGASLELGGCRAVITNRAEALALTGESTPEAAALALSQRAGTGVVTLGAHGALAACRSQLARASAPAIRVQHTTGAGDLFAAAYVWADLAGFDLTDRLRWATLYASQSLSSLTAFVGAATLADLVAAAREIGLSPPLSGSNQPPRLVG
jgi:sugar/nucleoside kinase (ribokinase family)